MPATPSGHVWVDGRLLPADGPHLSVFDRGFQLGDGIFETLRARGGRPPSSPSTSPGCAGPPPASTSPSPTTSTTLVATGIADLLAADGLDGPDGDASVRITVSRGPFRARGLLPPDEPSRATIAIQAWPVVPPPADHLERGLHLVASAVRRDPANPLATLKTTSRADYVYARLEARRAGADDALFLTIDGHLSEAHDAPTSSWSAGPPTGPRSWPRRRSTARSSPARPGRGCWPGATASACASIEGRLTPADLAAADEAFLSSQRRRGPARDPVRRVADRRRACPVRGPRRARADREALIAGQAVDAG